MKKFVPKSRVLPVKVSPQDDHYPVFIDFNERHQTRKKKWRMDPTILQHDFVQERLLALAGKYSDPTPDDWFNYKRESLLCLQGAQTKVNEIEDFKLTIAKSRIVL